MKIPDEQRNQFAKDLQFCGMPGYLTPDELADKYYRIFSHNNPWNFESNQQEFDTIDKMRQWGGSFVKQLATLYLRADPINKAILRNSFKKYFEQYKPEIIKEPIEELTEL